MKPIPHKIDGITLTLKEVNRNKVFNCKCEDHYYSCDLKKQLCLKPTKTTLTFTEVVFNIRNASGQGWSVKSGPFELIDTDGFAFGAKALCESLRPPRTAQVGTWNVSPGTQVNFILAFPELEPQQEVACILYVSDGSFYTFEINPPNPEAVELLQAREAAATLYAVENNWELKNLGRDVDRLELMVNSRLNNVLIPREAIKLENDIRQQSFQIEQQLRELSEKMKKLFEPKYREILASYTSQLELVKAREGERKKLDQKVEKLYGLSPREFEEYIAELFKALGYEKVTLTPASNDKGVDVLAEYQSTRVAIQCKKYKGLVGSPEIQAFLGAMRHAEAHKGFYVTTGTFSIEAEKIASEHPIELVDSIALGKLIQKAINKPD